MLAIIENLFREIRPEIIDTLLKDDCGTFSTIFAQSFRMVSFILIPYLVEKCPIFGLVFPKMSKNYPL